MLPFASGPYGATLSDSAWRIPSEIPSRTWSVSAFLPGRVSMVPRSFRPIPLMSAWLRVKVFLNPFGIESIRREINEAVPRRTAGLNNSVARVFVNIAGQGLRFSSSILWRVKEEAWCGGF